MARERLEIEVLNVDRARLQDHLKLIELLQPVRVVAVSAVRRAPRRLDVSDVPGSGPSARRNGRRVVRAGADFRVVRLNDETPPLRPEPLQSEDDVLKYIWRAGSRRPEGPRLRFGRYYAPAGAGSRKRRGRATHP